MTFVADGRQRTHACRRTATGKYPAASKSYARPLMNCSFLCNILLPQRRRHGTSVTLPPGSHTHERDRPVYPWLKRNIESFVSCGAKQRPTRCFAFSKAISSKRVSDENVLEKIPRAFGADGIRGADAVIRGRRVPRQQAAARVSQERPEASSQEVDAARLAIAISGTAHTRTGVRYGRPCIFFWRRPARYQLAWIRCAARAHRHRWASRDVAQAIHRDVMLAIRRVARR